MRKYLLADRMASRASFSSKSCLLMNSLLLRSFSPFCLSRSRYFQLPRRDKASAATTATQDFTNNETQAQSVLLNFIKRQSTLKTKESKIYNKAKSRGEQKQNYQIKVRRQGRFAESQSRPISRLSRNDQKSQLARQQESILTPEFTSELTTASDLVSKPVVSREVTTELLRSGQIVYESIKPNFEQPEVPKLAHNLSRVLFEPNVYHQLQDARSRIYNFTPFLKNIIKIEDFDFNKTTGFIPSGRDATLLNLANYLNTHNEQRRLKSKIHKKNKNTSKKYDIEYYSSTSSMTGLLCQLHYFLSNRRPPSFSNLSTTFSNIAPKFSAGARCASSVIVTPKQNATLDLKTLYSIDADKSTDNEIVLSVLGRSLEKLLVTDEAEFNNKFKLNSKAASSSSSSPSTPELDPESYHYAKIGKFLVRSQLDCYDPRLPNTGTFDLKTRAVCAVRYDMKYVQNEQKNKSGYQILKRYGQFESHEREKYDLIRSAMLKYSFQARIGNMDGIFICYHNIEKIFGFEYVPLSDLDDIFHSYSEEESHEEPNDLQVTDDVEDYKAGISSFVADNEFKFSYKILQDILDLIIKDYMPQDSDLNSFRLIFKERKRGNLSFLYVIFAPLTPDQVAKIQAIGIGKDKLLIDQNLSSLVESSDENHKVKASLDPNYYKIKEEVQKEKFYEVIEETLPNVRGFEVSVDHYFNDMLDTKMYPSPSSKDVKWSIRYEIKELSQETAQAMYPKFLKEKASLSWSQPPQQNEFINTLRHYGRFGRKREKYWRRLESKSGGGQVMWKPDSEFNK